jgi:hypothetical protein
LNPRRTTIGCEFLLFMFLCAYATFLAHDATASNIITPLLARHNHSISVCLHLAADAEGISWGCNEFAA